jgi:LPS export ABC transporter protein LptC
MIAVLFLSCQNNNVKQIQAFSHPPGAPEIVTENMEVIRTDSAVVSFKLTCPSYKIYSDEDEPYQEFPQGFNMQQFNKKGEFVSSIEASYGRYYNDKELWELKQNVKAVTEKGDTLYTELLYWDEKKNQIHSNEYVKIVQPERILTGIGFESDLQLRKWKILKPKGTIIIEVEE